MPKKNGLQKSFSGVLNKFRLKNRKSKPEKEKDIKDALNNVPDAILNIIYQYTEFQYPSLLKYEIINDEKENIKITSIVPLTEDKFAIIKLNTIITVYNRDQILYTLSEDQILYLIPFANKFLTCDTKTIKIWDIDTGELLSSGEIPDLISNIKILKDNNILVWTKTNFLCISDINGELSCIKIHDSIVSTNLLEFSNGNVGIAATSGNFEYIEILERLEYLTQSKELSTGSGYPRELIQASVLPNDTILSIGVLNLTYAQKGTITHYNIETSEIIKFEYDILLKKIFVLSNTVLIYGENSTTGIILEFNYNTKQIHKVVNCPKLLWDISIILPDDTCLIATEYDSNGNNSLIKINSIKMEVIEKSSTISALTYTNKYLIYGLTNGNIKIFK